MIAIRIHGRGGQGNVVAAYLLASVAIEQGAYAQAFPAFGAERRGAPVAAFVRIDDRPFRRRDQVANPDYLIIQDQALLHVPGLMGGLRKGGATLINGNLNPNELGVDFTGPAVCIAATALAQEHLGAPMPNTALLAAFLTLTDLFPLQALTQALATRFKGEVLKANSRLLGAAAKQVKPGIWREVSHAASA